MAQREWAFIGSRFLITQRRNKNQPFAVIHIYKPHKHTLKPNAKEYSPTTRQQKRQTTWRTKKNNEGITAPTRNWRFNNLATIKQQNHPMNNFEEYLRQGEPNKVEKIGSK